MNPILTEIRFAELRHPDASATDGRRWTITAALKTIFLVNAAVAVTFAIFYELVQVCLALDMSAWWIVAVLIGLYLRWWMGHCRRAQHVED